MKKKYGIKTGDDNFVLRDMKGKLWNHYCLTDKRTEEKNLWEKKETRKED